MVILGQILAFLAHLVPCPTPKAMRIGCPCGILICKWVQKLLLPLQKIRISAHNRQNLAQNLHFWSFWAKYWNFWPLSSYVRPKTMRTRCVGGFSVMRVPKLLLSPVKICLKLAFLVMFAGLFGALLVGWLVVVARGLYLARHLFTLYL